jgi:hypothetical protein
LYHIFLHASKAYRDLVDNNARARAWSSAASLARSKTNDQEDVQFFAPDVVQHSCC